MTHHPDSNPPEFKIGDEIGGYRIDTIVDLPTIASRLYQLVHLSTGSQHVHIRNADAENTFCVAFKTVPTDSSGVAHILEHTVLCGSARFAVRDPFFSMLKRSLSTFMNAFTASDWTMYPFSTQNRKDFYNLMDVYLDSAFFPKIDELSFKQEGHRLEVEPLPEGTGDFRLVFKGVVYNEMKGAMSSPDQVLARSLLKFLYPDTTYRHNSGGDPQAIPDLTHAQLKAFHRRHYHPSNAFFYTYGNLPLKGHLEFIEAKVLRRFQRIDPQTEVPNQPRWNQPQNVSAPYPLAKTESPEKKYQVCLAWLTADIRDTFEVLVLTVLEQVLLANAASPLRKALIDSALGSALSDGSGYDAENRDTMFSCGLKDVASSAAAAIEALIFDVLRRLAAEGIDAELIESAIHQIEFHRKEITNTPYPYGLKLLMSFGGGWLHGGQPARILQFEQDIERLRRELSKGGFLEERLRRYFIDNPHRVLFTLVPDQQMEARESERESERLAAIRARLSPSDLQTIRQQAEALKQLQESEEDLASLPTLALSDIPPDVHRVPKSDAIADVPADCYDQPTSGISYFSAAIGAGRLAEALISRVPFFCYALTKVGTARRDYMELARLIDLYTGGLGASANARTRFDEQGTCIPFIAFNGKCLVRNQAKMFELIQELMGDCQFSDLARLKQILLEYRAAMEAMIVHNGHRLAISLASRNFSTANAISEIWSGTHQLQTFKKITDSLSEASLAALAADLAAIAQSVFTRDNLIMALIGQRKDLAASASAVKRIKSALGDQSAAGFAAPDLPIPSQLPREGWSTSTAVSFVAQTFKTVRMGHEDAPSLAVLSKILRSLYLHREIREKGGAYGAFAVYNSEDGLFSFGSYRDPHIVATLKTYEGVVDFILSGSYDDEDIKEAILQVCSEIDKPDPPGPAARKAFFREIVQLSDAQRMRFKQQLLGLTREHVVQAAERYFSADNRDQAVAVISNADKLRQANQLLADRPLNLFAI
jgi:Zn-dependent M16 (insulinase) family peptidase